MCRVAWALANQRWNGSTTRLRQPLCNRLLAPGLFGSFRWGCRAAVALFGTVRKSFGVIPDSWVPQLHSRECRSDDRQTQCQRDGPSIPERWRNLENTPAETGREPVWRLVFRRPEPSGKNGPPVVRSTGQSPGERQQPLSESQSSRVPPQRRDSSPEDEDECQGEQKNPQNSKENIEKNTLLVALLGSLPRRQDPRSPKFKILGSGGRRRLGMAVRNGRNTHELQLKTGGPKLQVSNHQSETTAANDSRAPHGSTEFLIVELLSTGANELSESLRTPVLTRLLQQRFPRLDSNASRETINATGNYFFLSFAFRLRHT